VDLSSDFTYEIINYRREQCFGQKRVVNFNKLQELSHRYKSTFSSVDQEQNRELICPSGPDPVFSGIRGTDPQDLKHLATLLEPREDLASYCIFQTNQGTDAHVMQPKNTLDPFSVFSGMVHILGQPEEMNGGHIFITLEVRDQVTK
jgi:tRNA(Ile2)-agmatinylcytidine synthase